MPTQKNKRNFSIVTSRVRASPSRNHCRCQLPDEPEGKSTDYTIFRWPRPPNCCCRHNSSITATAVAAATPISKMKRSRHRWKITAQFHQLTVDHRRFQNHGTPFTQDKTPHRSATPRNAFHRTQDTAPEHHASTNGCLLVLHTSFTREKDVCSH